MAHIALYRTWRSQTFGDMVGQKHITQTLQNSLKEGRITHAYLFCGPRGTGKTSAAKILAKAVNCLDGSNQEPCNTCPACQGIADGSIMDVVEIDAASNNGVEEIRDIRDKVKYAPTAVRYKVYIIDEVHMLTTGAFNALLKTLEEPPAHVIFILATTEPHKLPVTIVSRCQRYDFHRVRLEEQVAHLEKVCREEGVAADREALEYIARLSDGGMRDALSLLDQVISFAGNRITYSDVLAVTGGLGEEQFGQLAEAMLKQDINEALRLVETCMQQGKSADKCMEDLICCFRDLLVLKLIPGTGLTTGRMSDSPEKRQLAEHFDRERLFDIIHTLNQYQNEMKFSAQPQTLFEIALMKICSMDSPQPSGGQPSSSELLALTRKVEQLEEQIGRLLKQGPPVAAAVNETNPPEGAQPAFGEKPQSASATARKKTVKLDGFVQDKDSPWSRQVIGNWTQILGQVKAKKITVHAWLVDGEPVSATEDALLLVFKSAMHRESTERPAHREIIEQAILETVGKPLKLATAMSKEWKEAESREMPVSPEPAPELKLEPETPGKYEEEWINEAIELFGEELVVIKDE